MIIYDLETIRPVAPTDPTDRIPGIEYAQDWRDFDGMGVACAVTYNYIDDRYEHYILDPTVPGSEKAKMQLLDNFQHYGWLPFTTVGYNNCAFHARLLRDSANIVIPAQASWDLLQELWAAAGFATADRLETRTGYSLNVVALANGLAGKTGIGRFVLPPVLWQRGRHQDVLDYCENDVKIIKGLVDLVLENGALNDPRNPSRKLRIRDEPLSRLRAAHFDAMAAYNFPVAGIAANNERIINTMTTIDFRHKVKLSQKNRPRIVCLCGSTRFADALQRANLEETLAGRIVLCCTRVDDELAAAGELTPNLKIKLDDLHISKIDLADEILVLNVGGYIGRSTARELRYALSAGKDVRFLEQAFVCSWCQLSEIPAEDRMHPIEHLRAYSEDTGGLVCVDCYENLLSLMALQ